MRFTIWAHDVRSATPERIPEIDRAPAVAHAPAADPLNVVDPGSNVDGRWGTSGILDAERWLGHGAWILDGPAHGLRVLPSSATVEGGRRLVLRWKPRGR